MAKRKSNWSKMIEEAGFRIRIYERPNGAGVYFSFIIDGKKTQRSTRRTDRKDAEEYAREVVRLVARDRLLGRSGPVKLGDVFRAYAEHKEPLLALDRRASATSRRKIFLRAWGAEQVIDDIGQMHIDRYVHLRTTGKLFHDHKYRRAEKGVRQGTLDTELRWLSSVFNFAVGFKIDGRRLLQTNPLRDVQWGREKNPRRPVASHQRFLETLKHVDTVDPMGRLHCILILARYTGRRESAICHLRASDFLRNETAIRETLASMGMDENSAKHMPHGAIRWREAEDKMGYATVTPISDRTRQGLDAYLASSPRMGDVPLFPSPRKPDLVIRRDLTARWLLKAESLAKLPKLRGGVFHPYRRLWATERKHLPDQDVAVAGGWRDAQVLRQSYQQADPATVLGVVEAGE